MTTQFRNRFFPTLHSPGSSAFNQIHEVGVFKLSKAGNSEVGPALPAPHPPHLLGQPLEHLPGSLQGLQAQFENHRPESLEAAACPTGLYSSRSSLGSISGYKTEFIP